MSLLREPCVIFFISWYAISPNTYHAHMVKKKKEKEQTNKHGARIVMFTDIEKKKKSESRCLHSSQVCGLETFHKVKNWQWLSPPI